MSAPATASLVVALGGWLRRPVIRRLWLGGLAFVTSAAVVCGSEWKRYSAPPFEMYAEVSDPDAREVLQLFRTLQRGFADFVAPVGGSRPADRESTGMPAPISIFLYGSVSSLVRELRGRPDIGGYYHPGAVRSVIALSAYPRGQSRGTCVHEFVHALVEQTEGNVPAWYTEGMATLFETLEIDGRVWRIGSPGARSRVVRRTDLLPLARFFAVTLTSPEYLGGAHQGIFHAQGWLWMHYLICGDHGVPWEKVRAFLRFASRGSSGPAPSDLQREFERTFGCTYAEMEPRLLRYSLGRRFKVFTLAWENPLGPETISSAPVSAETMQTRFAELRLRLYLDAAAQTVLEKWVQRRPDDGHALEALGSAAWVRGEPERAREWWARAEAAGWENPAMRRILRAR